MAPGRQSLASAPVKRLARNGEPAAASRPHPPHALTATNRLTLHASQRAAISFDNAAMRMVTGPWYV